MTEEAQVKEPKKPVTLSAFINPINSFNGYHISQELTKWAAKRKINISQIAGTVNQSLPKSYPYASKTITENQQLSFIQELLKFDLIILDLKACNLSNVEYIIKGIKNSNIEKDITIIGVSYIGTWKYTNPKVLQPGEEEEVIEDEFMKEQEEEPSNRPR